MSSQAVTGRLKMTSELRRLCVALGGERLKDRLAVEDERPREEPGRADPVQRTEETKIQSR